MPNEAFIVKAATTLIGDNGVLLQHSGITRQQRGLSTRLGGEPLEDGAEITDHAIAAPKTFDLDFVLSDFGGIQQVKERWAVLEAMADAAVTVRVLTETGVYPEMLIKRAESVETGRSMRVKLELREVLRRPKPVYIPPPPPPPPPSPPPRLPSVTVDEYHPDIFTEFTSNRDRGFLARRAAWHAQARRQRQEQARGGLRSLDQRDSRAAQFDQHIRLADRTGALDADVRRRVAALMARQEQSVTYRRNPEVVRGQVQLGRLQEADPTLADALNFDAVFATSLLAPSRITN